MDYEEIEKSYYPVPISNFSKYHKPDVVLRRGRLNRGEKRFVGNSSMSPRKYHTGKGITLRGKRLGLKRKYKKFGKLKEIQC